MDITCLLAAACGITGTAVSIAYQVQERNKLHFDYGLFTQLDPDYIQKDWAFRREKQAMEMAAGFINAFSWLLLAIPIVQTTVILSRGGTRKLAAHIAIGVLIVAGCSMEFLARFMHLGQSNWGVWLSTEYNLENWVTPTSGDNIGWRTLEVAHLVNFGTVIWIDSFEYLCLGFALILLYASVNSLPPGGPQITRALAGFGLFIGLFSLAEFIAGVLRLEDWSTFRVLTMLISVINQLILIPIFLLVLGCQLPRAMAQHKEEVVSRGAGLTTGSRHWVDSQRSPRSPNGSSAVEMTPQGQ